MPRFQVVYSGDYLDQRGELMFEDIGLKLYDQAADRIEYRFLEKIGRTITPEQIAEADGLVLLGMTADASTFANGAERLMAIARHGVGYDTVDLAACTANDVALVTTPPASRHPMAATSLAYMLALGKRLVWKDRLARRNRWNDPSKMDGDELQYKTLGIVGLGNIGREVVRLVAPFEMRVLGHDPYVPDEVFQSLGVERTPLPELFAQADFVAIHCALTPETRGMIDGALLGRMKPSAYLINLARGPIIVERDLVKALESRKIAAAAIDVFEEEPTPPDNALLEIDNVMLAPHSAGITRDFNRAMGTIDVEAMLACARGEAPQHVVNKDVLNRPGFLAKLARFRG